MSWRDRYEQASFRGIAFHVSRAELESGRRTHLHTFPNRDLPYSEDLGRRPRIYAVEGYVLGDDYYDKKEDLLRAAEAPGLGLLVHPYYGRLLVACRRVRFADSNRELGFARIDFEFEEAGEPLEPSVTINTRAAMDAAKKSGASAATNAFLAAYTLARKPFAEVRKLASSVGQASALIGSARRQVSDAAAFQREVAYVGAQAESLIYDSSALAESMVELMTFGTFPFDGEVRTSDTNSAVQFNELASLFDLAPEEPSDAESPVAAFNDLNQTLAVVAAAGLIPEVAWDSYEEAKEAAERVYVKIDDLRDHLADDSAINALRDVRSAVQDDLEARSDSLSRTSTITLPGSVPAVVLSNDLYGSVEQEQAILSRNGIDHPGFVDAARPIKVLLSA